MPSEAPRLDRCEHCGKLFKSVPGRALCQQCAGVVADESFGPQFTEEGGLLSEALQRFNALMRRYQEYIDEIDEESPLDESERRRLMYEAEPAEAEPEPVPECTLCGAPSLENSEFCLDCQSRLYRSLGDAATELFGRLEAVEKGPGGISSVLSKLEEARSRTASSRINPVATRRLRT